jgi:(p)ppGpp synthase/HD superfamily hydrolase
VIEKALKLILEHHAGQTDRAGKPYVLHPITVMTYVDTDEEKVVALLHDIVEDTDVNVYLLKRIFGDTVAEAVDLLTHRDEDSYTEYVQRLAHHTVARHVKMADLKHNMDITRIPEPKQRDFDRVRKYEKKLRYLTVIDEREAK